MVIKKYQAKTEEEAIEAAKKELGDDITVIHSRNVKPKGFFAFLRKMQVEITVAKEEEMDRPQNTAREALAKVNKVREQAERKAHRLHRSRRRLRYTARAQRTVRQ